MSSIKNKNTVSAYRWKKLFKILCIFIAGVMGISTVLIKYMPCLLLSARATLAFYSTLSSQIVSIKIMSFNWYNLCWIVLEHQVATLLMNIFHRLLSVSGIIQFCLTSNQKKIIVHLFIFLKRYILQDDICNSACEKNKTYRLLFGPAYLTLIDVLLTKSMISDQTDWSLDDKEAFRCYRQVKFY